MGDDPLVEDIERALRQATPGPWRECARDNSPEGDSITFWVEGPEHFGFGGDDMNYIVSPDLSRGVSTSDNAHLIAKAPEWLRALVDRLRRTEQELAAEREHYQQHGTSRFFREERDALKGEVSRLREALEEIAGLPSEITVRRNGESLPVHCQRCNRKREIARAALASPTGPETPQEEKQ